MSQIGVNVANSETPAATTSAWNTANAFMVGVSDWGPVGPVTISSQPQIATVVGPRSTTNQVIYDALDVYFREGGQNAFLSKVTGTGASAASVTISGSLLINAAYTGPYGNQISAVIANPGGSFSITLQDSYGNILAQSGSLASTAAAVAWAANVDQINIISLGATLPTAGTYTLSNGQNGTISITNWTTAINSFDPTLGPGQLLAPGQTNTTLNGIWSALGQGTLGTNRVAIGDMDDGTTAAVAVSALGSTFHSQGAGNIAFWAGNVTAPGVVPNTTRSIPPSPVIAALCARVDATGNPNQAGAGSSYVLQYCTGSATQVTGTNQTYSNTDISTLNDAGINTFANRYGAFENWGFASSIPSSTDVIFWQFSHMRLRMAITAACQIAAEPYVFSQLDGQGSDILSFQATLSNVLSGFYAVGALYGSTANDAFEVDTGSTVNPQTLLQQGILSAAVSVRMSPFAQLVKIVINSVPITTSLAASGT